MFSTMRRLLLLLAAPLLFLLISTAPSFGAPDGVVPPSWQRTLPMATCPAGDANCFRASPTLADVNNDGRLDVIVATFSGRVMALSADGSNDGRVLWERDIGPAVGAGPGGARISSSPAAADIDRNDGGRPEIVLGFGHEMVSNSPGGIIVLEHDGLVKSGWPKLSLGTHSNGVPKQVFATPALGDLDADGDLEIVAGGFDKRLYAFHHNGAMVAGFPPDSHLAGRFPTWPNLRDALADTIWSSPALGDLNGDGLPEVVTGSDEGNFDSRWGGNANGWTCPYALPANWAEGYCGGSVYAFDSSGQIMPGFPRYVLETVQSNPALVDVDQDGRDEIFVGTGAFYYQYSPDNPTYGFRLFGFESNGTWLPGWEGGKVLGGVTPASPSIGDIAGDDDPEVIIGASDGRVYAFRLNGQPVPGFPMQPRDRFGVTEGFDVGKTIVLADYDGDDKMELFFNLRSSTIIVDGNGTQLTSTNNGGDGRPAFGTNGWLINNPAVGDIDDDGRLELVVHDSNLFVWDLSSTNLTNDWPLWKQNPSRESRGAVPGFLDMEPGSSGVMCQTGEPCDPVGLITGDNGGDTPLSWSLNRGSTSSRVTFGSNNGTIGAGGRLMLSYTINTGGLGNAMHDMGSVQIDATTQSGAPAGSVTIELFFYKGDVYTTYLPITWNR